MAWDDGRLIYQAVGLALIVASILLYLFRPGSGANTVKFLGFEGTLSTPALVFLVLGAALFAFPLTPYFKERAEERRAAEAAAPPTIAAGPPAATPLAVQPAIGPAVAAVSAGTPAPQAAPAAALPTREVPEAEEPATVRPRHDLSGHYMSGGYDTLVTQSGDQLSWVNIDGAFNHRFAGRYVSPTEVVGIQTRVNRSDGCTARMRIRVDASDPDQVCGFARLDPPGERQCDLAGDYAERGCMTKR